MGYFCTVRTSLILLILFVCGPVTASLGQSGPDSANNPQITDSLEISWSSDSLYDSTELLLSIRNVDSTGTDSIRIEPERAEALPRQKRTESWVLFGIIFILILIGVMRALDSNRYYYAIRTPFKSYRSELGFNEQIPGIDLFQVGLILIYCLILGFAIYFYKPFGAVPQLDSGWRNYLIIVIILGAIYTLKYSLYYLIFQLLQQERLPGMLVVSMSNLAFAVSLFALPLLLVNYYGLNEILRLYLGKVLVIIFLIFSLYRFFRIIFLSLPTFSFGRVYLIFYFCTLEIIPLLILSRWTGFI